MLTLSYSLSCQLLFCSSSRHFSLLCFTGAWLCHIRTRSRSPATTTSAREWRMVLFIVLLIVSVFHITDVAPFLDTNSSFVVEAAMASNSVKRGAGFGVSSFFKLRFWLRVYVNASGGSGGGTRCIVNKIARFFKYRDISSYTGVKNSHRYYRP